MSENSSLDDADIDAFGVPGYFGKPAGEIRRKSEPEGFRDAFGYQTPLANQTYMFYSLQR